ncbi:carbon-nitrogen hydrolase family protein [Nesterenkonia sp.]|uniref:carbon-nitrogen hydrolase family protein n=1 Tax=Nesterenkonia sp. TaxID=704201 RepID=UPI00261C3BC4|nr:carbon-nitrogen hydrolase family protein [Nesterenkonia sp.]
MSSAVRLALGQVEPVIGDTAKNLQRMEQLAASAAEAGADLLILPEMHLTGYALGRQRTRALAEPADGPSAQHAAAIAQRCGLAILYGYPEEDSGAVFNTVGFVDSSGQRLFDTRKLHYFGDLDRQQFDRPAASAGEVVTWRGWKVGAAVCYDVEFPEVTRALAVAGAELVCVPTANMADYDQVQTTLLPARAVENQIYLAYANYCGADAVYRYGGLSRVIGPDGSAVAAAGREPQLLICQIDKPTLQRSRQQNPYLRDRRFDPAPREES